MALAVAPFLYCNDISDIVTIYRSLVAQLIEKVYTLFPIYVTFMVYRLMSVMKSEEEGDKPGIGVIIKQGVTGTLILTSRTEWETTVINIRLMKEKNIRR